MSSTYRLIGGICRRGIDGAIPLIHQTRSRIEVFPSKLQPGRIPIKIPDATNYCTNLASEQLNHLSYSHPGGEAMWVHDRIYGPIKKN